MAANGGRLPILSSRVLFLAGGQRPSRAARVYALDITGDLGAAD
jgi:hypothetical protein